MRGPRGKIVWVVAAAAASWTLALSLVAVTGVLVYMSGKNSEFWSNNSCDNCGQKALLAGTLAAAAIWLATSVMMGIRVLAGLVGGLLFGAVAGLVVMQVAGDWSDSDAVIGEIARVLPWGLGTLAVCTEIGMVIGVVLQVRQQSTRPKVPVLVPAVAVAVLGAVLTVLLLAKEPSRLETAYSTCDGKLEGVPGVALEDEGSSMIIEMPSEDEMTADPEASAEKFAAMDCVLEELGMPPSVAKYVDEALGSTSANMRSQPRELYWDGLLASLTYHPDNGLQMTVTEE